MIKAVLFDFYGTIAIYGSMQEADEKVGRIIYNSLIAKNSSIEYKDFIDKWNRTFSQPMTLEEKTEDSIFLTKISRLFIEYDLFYNTDEICKIGDMCLSLWHTYISFPEDLHDTLEHLKSKYSLALVSNFDHPKHLRRLLEKTDIIKYFDTIVISGEIGINKPDPRIFEKVLYELKLKANEVIFIGDNLIDDIQGAESAGCNTVLIDMNNRHKNYTGKKISKLSDIYISKLF